MTDQELDIRVKDKQVVDQNQDIDPEVDRPGGKDLEQKQELKDLLQQQKRDLQTAIRATDAGLKKLSQKPKSKRRSKRRPAAAPPLQ